MSTVPKVPNSPQETSNLKTQAQEGYEKEQKIRLSILDDIDKFCAEFGMSRTNFFRACDLGRSLQLANTNLETFEIIIEMTKGRVSDV